MNRSEPSASRRFLSLLYQSNPFYLITCAIVLFGIQMALTSHSEFGRSPLPIAMVFVVFTSAMAIAGVTIVRLGRVWDDARTIFLVLLLMFFALASSLDRWCLEQPRLACIILLSGLLFSVFITEFVLQSLSIRLLAGYRISYYLILGITFVFPLAFTIRNTVFPDLHSGWFVLVYPVLVSAGTIPLLCAIRQGRKALLENGTPWRWPFYPWSIFVILLFAVMARSLLIGASFDTSQSHSVSLQPFFFVPLLLSVCLILHEIGVVESVRSASWISMLLAPLVLVLSLMVPSTGAGREFAELVTATLGSPIWMTTLLLIFFYAHALGQQTKGSEFLLTASLLFAILCSKDALHWSELAPQNCWPLFVLAALQFAIEPEITSRRVFSALMYIVAGCAIVGFSLSGWTGAVVAAHLGLPAVILVMFRYSDLLSFRLRVFSYFLGPMAAFGSLILGAAEFVPMEFALIEVAIVGLLFNFACWKLLRDRIFRYSCTLCCVIALLGLTIWSFHQLGQVQDQTLAIFILVTLICFLVGLSISGLKGGATVVVKREWKRCLVYVRKRRRAVSAG